MMNRPGKNKPHTQIGNHGGKNRPKRVPPYKTNGLPFQAGQIPQAPPQIPNFLPSTPDFSRGMSSINDARSQAENRYGTTTGMIKPQMDLQYARLDTDQQLAGRRLDENMADRGVFTSGFRPKLYQEQVATPFGRQRQDIATQGAQAYADASMNYGDQLVGFGQDEFNLYNDTAQETASQPYLGFGYGGYNLPNQSGPYLSSKGSGQGPRKNNDKGKTRPNGRNRGRK